MGFILLREEQVDLHHIGRFGFGRSANSHQQISMSNSIFHPRGATPLIQGAFFLGRAGIQVDSLANGACGRDVPAADAWIEEPVLGSWMGECLSEIVLQRMLRLHELATSFQPLDMMWSILGWCSSVGSKHCDAKHLPQLSPVLPLSPDVSPPLLPPRYLAEMIKNGKKQRIFILNTCNEYARFRTCVHMYIYIMYIYVCIPIYVICTFCLYMYRDTVHVYSPFRAFGDRGSRSWKGFPWSWPC